MREPVLRPDPSSTGTAEPIFVPGFPGGREPAAFVPGEASPPLESGTPPAAPRGYSYPSPFTRYENLHHYRKHPYRSVGRLFFTQNGNDYVCSAASIGNFAVITAGHCVHTGKGAEAGWSDNMIFVPAYKDGDAPYGQWSAASVLTNSFWYGDADLRYDYGGAVLYRRNRKKISRVVGSLGFAANIGTGQHWFSLGYPVAPPFDGRWLFSCAASYGYSDTAYGLPPPSGIGCDMTGGCSGGPWILGMGGGNFVNGVNSYRYLGSNLELYSPYFDTDTSSFYQELVSARP